jgi:hypothetical protein
MLYSRRELRHVALAALPVGGLLGRGSLVAGLQGEGSDRLAEVAKCV